MGDSPADYSKIAELQEVRQLYEESEARHASELAERERTIEELRQTLEVHEARIRETAEEVELQREKRKKELMERDQKIVELRARIKELSSSPKSSRGFFARDRS